eukprot:1651336-Prymnesium_polylepis.1
MHASERYGDLTTCFGQTFLTTRVQLGRPSSWEMDDNPCLATIIRQLNESAKTFVNPRLLLPPALFMSHNLAT